MNQNSRYKVTSPVEHDFYKLLNDTNASIDRRNNINNCTFEPIYDEIS